MIKTKSVDFSYASSWHADQFGFSKTGCYTVCELSKRGNEIVKSNSVAGFATKKEAFAHAEKMDMPYDTYSLLPAIEHAPTVANTHYAFRRVKGGWVNCGMVSDNERDFYAKHYMAGQPRENGEKTDECATAVAFMPYCIEGTNFVTQEMIDADAVQVIY